MTRPERAQSGHEPSAGGGTALDPGTRRLLLALPLAFLAHDIGEVRGAEELNRAGAELLRHHPRLAKHVAASREQTGVAVAILAVGAVTLAAAAARPGAGPAAVRPGGRSWETPSRTGVLG